LVESALGKPQADLDGSVATDADDLVAFIGDIFEFAEHEQALLLDSVLEIAGGAGLAVAGSLSVRG
jgi:hypothetical protein